MDHHIDFGGQYSGGSDSEERERSTFFCTGEFAERDLSPKVKENSQRRSQSQRSTKQPRATSNRHSGTRHRVLQPLRGKEFGPQVQGRKQQEEMASNTRNSSKEMNKMKKQMEEMQKENESLKRKSEADEKKLSKKMRGGAGPDTWAVVENKALVTYFKNEAKTTSWKKCKFIGSEAELQTLVLIILKTTDDWKKVVDLDETDLKHMLTQYTKVYGKYVTNAINGKRNALQQSLKVEYKKMRKEGQKYSAAQFLNSAQRLNIALLSQNGKGGAKNKKLNLENKKYRNRFDVWVDRVMPVVAGKDWKVETRCMTTMGVPLDGSADGPPPVSVADEAITVVIIENCEEKWNYQVRREVAGKDLDLDKMEKMVKYTTSKGGSNAFGAWSKEGRLRFKEIRGKIKKARASEEAKAGEKQCRKRLFKKHDMQKKLDAKKKNATPNIPIIDLAGAEVGFGSGDEEDVSIVEYKTDEDEGDSGADDSDDDKTVGEEEEPTKKGVAPKKSKNPLNDGVEPELNDLVPDTTEEFAAREADRQAARAEEKAKKVAAKNKKEAAAAKKKERAAKKKEGEGNEEDSDEEDKEEDDDDEEVVKDNEGAGRSEAKASNVEDTEGEEKKDEDED